VGLGKFSIWRFTISHARPTGKSFLFKFSTNASTLGGGFARGLAWAGIAVAAQEHLVAGALQADRNHDDGPARRRQVIHQAVDFAAGAHVHAARRLVKDHGPRLPRQPLAQHHLLLVAARQEADRLVRAGRLHRQPRRQVARQPPLALRHDPAERPQYGQIIEIRERKIPLHALGQDQAVPPAVPTPTPVSVPRPLRIAAAVGWRLLVVAAALFVLGAVVAGAAALALVRMSAGGFADAATPGLFLGMAIGRPGCFFTGCCAGRATASRFGIWSSDGRIGTRRVPTQLLEALIALVIGSVSLLLVTRFVPAASGIVFIEALAAYTLARQLLLPLRAEPRKSSLGGPLTIVASAIVLAGGILWSLVVAQGWLGS